MLRFDAGGEVIPPTLCSIVGVDDALILAGIAAAGAGASYLGTKDTNSANAAMNRATMIFNRDENTRNFEHNWDVIKGTQEYNDWQARLARDFAERMSNTSYQRARSDMLAAGLNPILAYQQGGASTPQAAQASASSPGVSVLGAPAQHRMENALSPAVATAMQAAQTVMGVQQAAAQIDQTKAQTGLAAASEANQRAQAAYNSASAITEAQRTGLVKSQRASEAVLPSLRTAQAAAASAASVESLQRAETEPERRSLMREQGREAVERSNQARTEWQQRETYGPPGSVSSTVGGVSQILRSIGQAAGFRY